MGKLYKSRALVLFRRVYKENDEILGLFTPGYGRLDVVVRGSKKVKSDLVGKLEPFVEINGMFARGQAYSYLVQAEVVHSYQGVLADYERLCWGAFILELWAACVAPADINEEPLSNLDWEEAFGPFYELLLEALGALTEARSLRLLACWSEWNLLRLLGHELFTERCVLCGGTGLVGVSYDEGGLVCSRCWRKLSASGRVQVQSLTPRLVTMVCHLPQLGSHKAAEVALDSSEARRLEDVVWRHWRACGLPWLKVRRLVDRLQ